MPTKREGISDRRFSASSMPRADLMLLNIFLFQAEFFRRVQHEHLHPNI